MSVSIRDPRFTQVVGPGVNFERIATDCLFTEGPLWHPREQYLLWSDMPGDHLRRWSARDGVSTYRKPCNMSNGLTWDRQGRLLACEHASSQITRPGGLKVCFQKSEPRKPTDPFRPQSRRWTCRSEASAIGAGCSFRSTKRNGRKPPFSALPSENLKGKR